MAPLGEWIEGARPRTLFLAGSPVVAGTGVAAHDGSVQWWRAALALVVALALQIGVNYANDYSDGIRGTDAVRVGPLRLVGSGAARPGAVRAAALASFPVGALAGLVLAAATSWWLVAVGAAAIAAAWGYTGTSRPYGYRAMGEVAVFVFFGVVAVCGTAYVQTRRITPVSLLTATAIGLLACALLVANNLRDIPGDLATGKRTLAVVLGAARTRTLFTVLVAVPFVLAVILAAIVRWWPLLALAALPLAAGAIAPVRRGAVGRALIPTLRSTGILALVFAVLLALGLSA